MGGLLEEMMNNHLWSKSRQPVSCCAAPPPPGRTPGGGGGTMSLKKNYDHKTTHHPLLPHRPSPADLLRLPRCEAPEASPDRYKPQPRSSCGMDGGTITLTQTLTLTPPHKKTPHINCHHAF